MIRKYLFLGLTLVLIVALVNLIIRGRRLEKQQAGKSVETIKESKPTPTRVLRPDDLEIIGSSMQRDAAGPALHTVEIRNNGRDSYSRIQLRIAYMDRGGKLLETKHYSIFRNISPGGRTRVTDIRVEGVPDLAARARVTIDYADLDTKS